MSDPANIERYTNEPIHFRSDKTTRFDFDALRKQARESEKLVERGNDDNPNIFYRQGCATGYIRLRDLAATDPLIAAQHVESTVIELIWNGSELARLGATINDLAALNTRATVNQIPVETEITPPKWFNPNEMDVDLGDAGNVKIGSAEFSIKSVGATQTITRRLMKQSSVNLDTYVPGLFSRAMRRGLDTAALTGDGVLEPLGILNNSDIQTITTNDPLGGVLTALAQIDREPQDANLPTLGILASPEMRQRLMAVDSRQRWQIDSRTGRESCCGAGAATTNAITATQAIVADWSLLRMYIDAIELRVLNEDANGKTQMFAAMDAGLTLGYPSSFVLIELANEKAKKAG